MFVNCIFCLYKPSQPVYYFMDVSELIKEAKQGSAASQKCLFDLLSDKMMLVCRRYLKSREDAEEVLLDGFYKFFKNLSSFHYQGDSALYAWLKKIMINECLMTLRKKNVFTIVIESAAKDISLEEEALNDLSAKEIFDLIIQLPVGYRTVFKRFIAYNRFNNFGWCKWCICTEY